MTSSILHVFKNKSTFKKLVKFRTSGVNFYEFECTPNRLGDNRNCIYKKIQGYGSYDKDIFRSELLSAFLLEGAIYMF